MEKRGREKGGEGVGVCSNQRRKKNEGRREITVLYHHSGTFCLAPSTLPILMHVNGLEVPPFILFFVCVTLPARLQAACLEPPSRDCCCLWRVLAFL
jgi:hypothetical protein